MSIQLQYLNTNYDKDSHLSAAIPNCYLKPLVLMNLEVTTVHSEVGCHFNEYKLANGFGV